MILLLLLLLIIIVISLIKKMLIKTPDNRISIEEISESNWILNK